jgi:NAD(P)-dependent dehydrogenase (short-subunit alcohol dehydrogenase family)
LTGAFGEIGRATCEYLKFLKTNLILLDLTENVDFEFARKLEKLGSCVDIYPVNFEYKEIRRQIFTEIRNRYSIIDVLINNAAFVGNSKLNGWAVPFEDQSIESWDRAINVNLSAPFELIQLVTPSLKKSDKASVVNIGSIYGEFGPDWRIYESTEIGNPAAYAASKGGLLQITRWLATTLAPEIRVNAVSPGGIWRNQSTNFVEKYNQRVPLMRMAKVEDIVPSIAFLASSDSKYITGQNLRVDGGLSAW